MEIRAGGLDHPDVQALLRLHRDEALGSTPRENAHALDVDGLRAGDVRFWTAWDGATLLGMAALRRLEAGHVEVKSMRTAPAAVRRGVGRALLTYLIEVARTDRYTRLSLETGTAPSYDAANRLYEAAGFEDGPAFGGYPESAHNRFMTIVL
ncbi:MAG: family N-acetyltransferase [Sphingomonas bacterium]|uniref:GNAT family N-acetyltransferase n=1 Tax=Sphingomonas bacterium TaxID=1895847 RepID=UPI0026291093|nr:GNAT family N-acetyltransferase [Sphingomonas bacterium]MDB5694502.1 family N-acetyltransferase [Sphingomonas bacterium]